MNVIVQRKMYLFCYILLLHLRVVYYYVLYLTILYLVLK